MCTSVIWGTVWTVNVLQNVLFFTFRILVVFNSGWYILSTPYVLFPKTAEIHSDQAIHLRSASADKETDVNKLEFWFQTPSPLTPAHHLKLHYPAIMQNDTSMQHTLCSCLPNYSHGGDQFEVRLSPPAEYLAWCRRFSHNSCLLQAKPVNHLDVNGAWYLPL